MKKFTFEDFEFNSQTGEVFLNYSIEGDKKIEFQEKFVFPMPEDFDWEKLPEEKKELISRISFNLHLACGTSYWKTYCPKQVEIKSGELSSEQARFWEKLYFKGLGQFYFENNLDPNELAPKFPASDGTDLQPIEVELSSGNLLPWGGGKDSAVSAEILKKLGESFVLITGNDSVPQQKTEKVAGKKRIIFERKISENLKDLQEDHGAFAGHVPITAIYAFACLFVAVIEGFDKIILSNEKSSNVGNVYYKGLEVNHQYSKSFEFEKDIAEYFGKFLTRDVKYFSLLRGWHELKIAEIFSGHPEYFQKFSSCNVANFKLDKSENLESELWCGECPKCAFVFLMLSAFLKKDKLIKIFGKNLFDDKKFEKTFLEILGCKNFKPLECVGTVEESRLAFLKAVEGGEFEESFLVKKLKKITLETKEQVLENEKEIMSFSEDNFISDNWKKEIRNW